MSVVVTLLKDAMLLIVACFSSREGSARRRRRRKKKDGRIKGIKKKGEKDIYFFFFTFNRFTRRKHILDREFFYRCACRKETTPTIVGCRDSQNAEGRDAVVMISVGGKGCWMKGRNVPFFFCERVEVGCVMIFLMFLPFLFFQCIPWLKGP